MKYLLAKDSAYLGKTLSSNSNDLPFITSPTNSEYKRNAFLSFNVLDTDSIRSSMDFLVISTLSFHPFIFITNDDPSFSLIGPKTWLTETSSPENNKLSIVSSFESIQLTSLSGILPLNAYLYIWSISNPLSIALATESLNAPPGKEK